ncbi:glucose-6-phosphate isomerase [bacterium]|nr:glucose-6-phosphate isomerase [bacterium]
MLKINLTNCLSDTINENGITKHEIGAARTEVARAHNELKKAHESGALGFMDLPFKNDVVDEIQKIAVKVKSKFDNLVVLGIGGSGLGLRCLTQALLKPTHNYLTPGERLGHPRIFVCDNIDPYFFNSLLKYIDVKKTCFNVISKSGTTTETISQFLIIKELLVKYLGFENYRDNLIFTTDPEKGPLRDMAINEGIATFDIPQNVGGRFSVLTPVGLFPAAVVGVDIKGMLKGAGDISRSCNTPELEKNIVYNLAVVKYLLCKKRQKTISVMMPYADSLSLFSDWYVQLWAESLGKEGSGQTPIKAVGATDQHSQLQLYREGPKDKIITLLGVEKFQDDLQLPLIREDNSPFKYLSNHMMSHVLKTEQIATTKALTEAGVPNMTITLPEVDAYHIGQLMMLYQVATAITGSLMKINAYDQPGVELGKKLTKEILSKEK